MKKLFTLLLILIPFIGFSQGEFSVIDGLNICIAKPANYSTAKKYPVIIFFPGAGEIGSDKNKLVKQGVNAYVKQGWDLKADGVEFIAVSIQPNQGYPRPFAIKPTVDKVLSTLSYNPDYVIGTGLSRGAWIVNNDAQYYKYNSSFTHIINIAGQRPDDNFQSGDKYPNSFKHYKGKYLGLEQRYDFRDIKSITDAINSAYPQNATYLQTTLGSANHCCWDLFYGGNGTQPTRFAELGNKNIYEWAASFIKTTPTPQPEPNPQPEPDNCDSIEAAITNKIKSLRDSVDFLKNENNLLYSEIDNLKNLNYAQQRTIEKLEQWMKETMEILREFLKKADEYK